MEVVKWLCFTLLHVLTCVQTERTVGDYCLLKNGHRGMCTFLRDCSSAMMAIEVQKPVVCGFYRNTVIVCCGDNTLPFTNPPDTEEDDKLVFNPSRPYISSNPTPWRPQSKPYSDHSIPEVKTEKTYLEVPKRPDEIPRPNQSEVLKRPDDQRYSTTGVQHRPDKFPGPTQSEFPKRPDDHRYSTTGVQYRPDRIPGPTQSVVPKRPDDQRYSTTGVQHRPDRIPGLTQSEVPKRPDDQRYSTTGVQHRPDRIPGPTHQAVVLQNDRDRIPTNGHKHTSSEYPNREDITPVHHSNKPVTSLRKSQIKCREYSQLVTHKVEALPLLPDPTPVEVEVARCDIQKLPLIVGGEKTMPGEFPHMAALGYQDGRNIAWNCGGSLISDRYIMTAAHCTVTSKGPPVIARLGELHLKRGDDGAQPRDYTISSIIRHPNYKAPAKYNDIALLRLSHPVQFNKYIRPACLFADEQFPVNKTVATGWGQIDYAEKQSDVLLKVVLDIIDNSQCNHLYRSSAQTQALSQGITSSMMCAGVLKGGKDTCHGDSGGPIQITSGQNKCIYYVIGVTSFGKFCAAENAPGVYTRVSEFLPWIEREVWP